MKLRFYYCTVCGKVITVLDGEDIPTFCCGRPMDEIVPNREDMSTEKHVPVFSAISNTVMVRVGSIPHPMTDSHSITWIGLRTTSGFQFKKLQPGDNPEAGFFLNPDERAEAAYAYCNLHGLWCSEKGLRYE